MSLAIKNEGWPSGCNKDIPTLAAPGISQPCCGSAYLFQNPPEPPDS